MFQKAGIFSKRAMGLMGRRFFLLFLFLLSTLLIYPYAETNGVVYMVFRTLGSAGILLAVYAVGLRRSFLIIALALSIPALIQHNLLPRPDHGILPILNIILTLAFHVFVIVVIFRRVFRNESPSSETIFGALCVYLLIGFLFGSIYQLLTAFEPRAFYLDPVVNAHAFPDRFDLLYYSFTAMTALGATGMVAVSQHARSLTVIESIIGVLFLAVLVARLIGAYRPGPSSNSH